MKTKLLLLFLAFVALTSVFFIVNNQENASKKIESEKLSEYTITPQDECVVCIQEESWNNKKCCTDSFDIECGTKNGVIRKFDLHPLFNGMLKKCFQKAPDTGKGCSEGKECLSGVCNLEDAIQSKKCNLIKKELTGETSVYYDVDFYTATYSCENAKPGVCTETINDGLNPGGISHIFKMEGNTLVETLVSGPIR